MNIPGVSAFSAITLSIATALTPAGAAHAEQQSVNISCNMGSDYTTSLSGQAFVFENTRGRNKRLVLGGGKLFINGEPAALSPADQARIDGFEKELRLLVPESRKVATEAIVMAIDALSSVSTAMSGDEADSRGADAVRAKAIAAANNSKTLPFFNDEAMQGIVEPIVAEYVPKITGNALGFAVKAMFAGEQKNKAMEARMQAMEKDLDSRMRARAKSLEPLAESMCKRIQRMDRIDDSLEIRLPDGKPINFLYAAKSE